MVRLRLFRPERWEGTNDTNIVHHEWSGTEAILFTLWENLRPQP
jgi:hypothetical protein